MEPDPPLRDLGNLTGATECAHGIGLDSFCQRCGAAFEAAIKRVDTVTLQLNPSELRVTKVTISEEAGDATLLVWEGWCVCAGSTPVTPANQSRAVAEQNLAALRSAIAAR